MSSIPSGRAALQQQRAVLAELFRSGERAISDFTDTRVCKLYLCGLCPADLFMNTKYALPQCMNVHDDALRAQYESALGKGGPTYEAELLRQLEDIALRAERRTLMDARRAEDDEGPSCHLPRVDTERVPEVEALTREVEAKERECEAALAGGRMGAAAALEEELAALRRKKCMEQARACRAPPVGVPEGKTPHSRMRICSGCGLQVNLVDADDRTADHFQGRAHLGHVTTTFWLGKLRASKAARQAAQAGGAAGAAAPGAAAVGTAAAGAAAAGGSGGSSSAPAAVPGR